MLLRSPVVRLVIAAAACVALYLLLDGGQWAFARFVLLPPYFRFLLLVNLGIWAWAVNVHGLSATGIDVARLMDDGSATTHQHRLVPTVDGDDDDEERTSDGDDKPLSHRPISYTAIYGIACVFTALTLVSMIVFLDLADKWGEESAEFIPALTYVVLIGLVCWPYAGFYERERNAFMRSLKRTVTGGFTSAVPFCDVIFADILTSFSKVMGDLQIVFADFVTVDDDGLVPAPTTSVAPSQTVTFNAVDFVSPLIVCIPYLLRLRQCIAEYSQTSKPSVRSRHFANAIKYVSGLPVVMSGFTINWMEAQYHRRHSSSQFEGEDVGLRDTDVSNTRHRLNVAIGMWIFFSLVHSIYTLYWDVVMDWHLGNLRNRYHPSGSPIKGPALLSPRTGAGLSITTGSNGIVAAAGPRYPMFLRPAMHFRPFWVYYVAIFVDAVLRFSWVVRVTLLWRVADSVGVVVGSAGGGGGGGGGGGDGLVAAAAAGQSPLNGTKQALVAIDVALKLLEIARRWMWTFLRIEREWVSRPSYAARGAHHGASGDAMSPMIDSPEHRGVW
ncbi:protein-ER retention protein [Geranomyces michiganensis]|nr:protein-ER retention protein [Geranomyces michiganensis]